MRANKPWLTQDANTLNKWYKICIHGLFNIWLAQATAYPGLKALGCAYTSFGLHCFWVAEAMCIFWVCAVLFSVLML